MRRSYLAAFAALALAPFVLSGCGSSRPTTPGGLAAQEAADDMAIQAVLSLNVVGGDLKGAVGSTPSRPQLIATGFRVRPLRAASAQWETTYVQGGFTFEAQRYFYDVNDVLLADWTPAAVRVSWASRAYGTAASVIDTTTLGHGALIDVRGIQSGQDTLKVDGGWSDRRQNVFCSLDGLRKRYFPWESATTIGAVRFLKSQIAVGPGPIPIGGSVTFVVSADRLRSNNVADVVAHFDAIVVVTFNGTDTPTIVVNGTYHYLWHLSTNQVTRA